MSVHQHIAHGKVLSQADQGVIDRLVAVGVILTQHIAHAGGRLLEGLVAGEAALIHGVEDAPVDGLQTVPHIGQGPAHDDRHGVLDVRVLHLMLQIDLHDLLVGKGDIFALVFVFGCQIENLRCSLWEPPAACPKRRAAVRCIP